MGSDSFTIKKIRTLADMQMGPTILQKDLSDDGLPVFSAGNQEQLWGFTNKKVKAFPKGTLIVPARGTIGIPKLPQLDSFTCTQTTIAVQAKEGLDIRYLYYFLHSINWDDVVSGVAIPMLTISRLGEIDMPVPRMEEQLQIVDKLDAILPRVRQVKARLEKIPILLKKFRQSVFSAACSGALLENYDTYDHDKWAEVTRMLENDANDSINGFPDHWIMIDLGRLSEGFQYGTSKKSEVRGLVPVLRMGNMKNGEIDWSDLKYTSNYSDITKYALSDGDVLFNRTNSPDLVGKTSIFQGQNKAIFAGYIIKIKNRKELLLSEYLTYCLNSNYGRQWCKEVRTDGVGQSNINAAVLSTFLIPLPPIEEQTEIVRQVQQLLKLEDTIYTKYQMAVSRFEKIEQSIIAKAFRGKLFEPALDSEHMKSW